MKKKKAILLVGNPKQQSDIQYISGLSILSRMIILLHGRKRYIIVPQLEIGRARRCKQLQGFQIFTPDDFPKRRGEKKQTPATLIKRLLRKAGVRSVQVPGWTSIGAAEMLNKAGIRTSILKEAVCPQREVKSKDEIRKIRDAQQAAVIAMRSAIGLIASTSIDHAGILRVGRQRLTSEMLRTHIHRVLMEHDVVCTDLIAAGGKQAADPHEPGHGPLHAGETIVMDIFPQHIDHGYWGDITRTVVRGSASTELRRMYHAVRSAQSQALAGIKSGACTGRIHRRAADEIERRGFVTKLVDGRKVGFTHSTGHSVGLAIHEGPGFSPGSKARLRAGNVVTVEPGLYYPDLGGIRIEDTVLVTRTGWRYLAPCEKKFEI